MEPRPKGPREHIPPILLEGGQGTIHTGLPTHVLKADSKATRGAYSLYEETFPPGHPGPAIHIHHDQEEAFYMIAGELTFLLGDQLITANAGTFVLVPAGWRHGFANRSSEVARVINIHSPRGFEHYFEQIGKWAASGSNASSIRQYAEEHGVEIVGRPLGPGRAAARFWRPALAGATP